MKLDNKSITKRVDNRWQAKYVVDGKRHYVYGKTQKECYLKLKEALLDIQKIAARKTREIYPNLNSWMEKWITIYKEPFNKPATTAKHWSIYKKYIKESKIGSKSMNAITLMELQELLVGIEYSRTRQLVCLMLRESFRTAYKNGVIKKNITEDLIIPKHIKTERRGFSTEEEARFLKEAVRSKYYELYLLQLFGGLRIGEVLALRGTDIKDNYFIVDESKNDINEISSTKNSKIRKVPIFKGLEFLLNKNKTSSELLYPGISRISVYDEFKKICEHNGIQDVPMHGLRHTFGTRSAERGITAKQVQLWMGHSDVSVTLKYYTNINSEFEQANIDRKNK